jgi:hypothetical protein
VGNGKSLQERIDVRGKLARQVFGNVGYVVLSGAGGKDVCAACIPAFEAKVLAIDQTLYWQVFAEEDAAMYAVGVLNSEALTEAITPFNPKGDFGERHVHTLPYKMVPTFDPTNSNHIRIAALTRVLIIEAKKIVDGDPSLNNPARALAARRRKLREELKDLSQFVELDDLCNSILASPAGGKCRA